MKHVSLISILSCAGLLAACSEIPPSAYYDRGAPENLLDSSSEVVNMSLSSRNVLAQLADTLAQDPPSRAELNCGRGDAMCSEARNLFDQHGVPVEITGAGDGVTLIYERVVARDCEQRYIDNSINPYNLHPPTFGCSISANMVQMVSDKRQFLSPSLLDFHDGAKAAQSYGNYLKPTTTTQGSGGWAVRSSTGSGSATGSFK